MQTGFSEKSDIWSFGATVFEMLTGYPPFFDENTNKWTIMHKIAGTEQLPYLDGQIYSLEARAFVYACLKRDPKLRPSAKELLLTDFLKEQRSMENKNDAVSNLKNVPIDENVKVAMNKIILDGKERRNSGQFSDAMKEKMAALKPQGGTPVAQTLFANRNKNGSSGFNALSNSVMNLNLHKDTNIEEGSESKESDEDDLKELFGPFLGLEGQPKLKVFPEDLINRDLSSDIHSHFNFQRVNSVDISKKTSLKSLIGDSKLKVPDYLKKEVQGTEESEEYFKFEGTDDIGTNSAPIIENKKKEGSILSLGLRLTKFRDNSMKKKISVKMSVYDLENNMQDDTIINLDDSYEDNREKEQDLNESIMLISENPDALVNKKQIFSKAGATKDIIEFL